MEASSPTRHVLIFDHPRSCSNLLGRLLDTHPSTTRLHRPWRNARTRGPDKPVLSITPETVERFQQRRQAVEQQDYSQVTVAKANEDVLKAIKKAREEVRNPERTPLAQSLILLKGKVAIIQDHTAVLITDPIIHVVLKDPTYLPPLEEPNITLLPPCLLTNSLPVLLIRHPALALPSFLRMHLQEKMLVPEDEMFRFWISLRWLRIIHAHLESLLLEPIIIDASDLVQHTSTLMTKLCAHVSIAPDQIQETWRPGEAIQKEKDIDENWMETLRKSSGVIRDGRGSDEGIRIGDLVGRWEEEFGVERAGVLRGMVEGEMGDYWFLWERRVRV
ncbi:hypothetical protein PRZ48_004021 [Zasmidium cellare]|uniref:Uncharacterized protein n=1 Tax=Zasmidium cellare TaxID=395010 RepID=A0ABR0EWQ0_ZASCE|nr:hypothetical protein PRZ48_004021 [Zasmidium cellare]